MKALDQIGRCVRGQIRIITSIYNALLHVHFKRIKLFTYLQTVFLLGLIGFCGLNHCNENYTQSNDYGIKDHDFWIREKIFILRYTKTLLLNLKFRYITKYVRNITVSDVNLWMNPWYLLFYLSTKSTGLQKSSSW